MKKIPKKVLNLAFTSNSEEEFNKKLIDEGFNYSNDEIKQIFESVANEKQQEIENEELENVAGGSSDYKPSSGC